MEKFLLIIDGPMGAGKTTVAKLLHGKLKNTVHLGLDRIKWFVSDFRRTKSQDDLTRTVVKAMAEECLHQGVSVILDQAMRAEQVLTYRKIARAHQAKFLLYQLQASRAVLLERVRQRPRRPGKPKVSPSRIMRNYRIFIANRQIGTVAFDTESLSARQVANRILKDLKTVRQFS